MIKLRDKITSSEVMFPIVLLCPVIYLTSSIGFFFGLSIASFHLPVSILLVLSINHFFHSKNYHSTFMSLFLIVLITALGLFFNNLMYDLFHDSRTYQFSAIYFLFSGWNPIYDWNPCDTSTTGLCSFFRSPIEFYPKAYWVVATTFYKLFKSIGSTHIINFFMMISCGWVSFQFCRKVLKLGMLLCILFSVSWTLNPTAVWQLFSNYIDGTHVAGLSIIFFGSILFLNIKSRRWLWLVLLFIPFIINLKFTALVYSLILGLGVISYGLINKIKETKKLFLGCLAAILFGILVTGQNPYVGNTVLYGTPFYYAIKGDGSDLMSSRAAPDFNIKNKFEKVFLSLFSVGFTDRPKPKLEIPFSRFEHRPTLFSANGPFFSGTLVLMLFGVFFINRSGWVLLSGCLLSIFSTSAAWHTRLTPQIWWIPILVVGLCASSLFSSGRYPKFRKTLAFLVLSILILNSRTVISYYYERQFNETAKAKKFLKNRPEISYVISEIKFALYSRIFIKEQVVTSKEIADCAPLIPVSLETFRGLDICADPEKDDQ